mgnify:CR=1 FL=1
MKTERILRAILDKHYVPFGSTSDDWINDAERMSRCDEAASDGSDGSTHAEILQDYRETLRNAIPYRCERLRDAADAYVSDLESWHETNGTLDQQIG